MHYSRNKWREDTRKANRQTFVFFGVAIFAIAFALASWGLFVDRVSDSRLIINCASFTSVADATTFAAANPQYSKRLNPLHKLSACSSYNYGTAN